MYDCVSRVHCIAYRCIAFETVWSPCVGAEKYNMDMRLL